MAAMDREVLNTWEVTYAYELADIIQQADEIAAEDTEGGDLSFVYMTAADKNVDVVRLIKVDLSDSFAYELELA